ncbi:MAG: hypothetical protein U9N61_02130 [Euryarchaeota archaeon]|nr:hypothetical protein [Euryarchaeota archaeon]
METLDEQIKIKVIRKEELTEVPVQFKVENHTNADIAYPKYIKLFNWRDVEGGDCTELFKSLKSWFGLALDNPECATHYYNPKMGIYITIQVADDTYEVYLDMREDMEEVALFTRKWKEEEGYVYHHLYTGKVCGSDTLNIFQKGEDTTVILPAAVTLPYKTKQEFKVYLGNERAIDFELGITEEGSAHCEKVFGFSDWCTRTMTPKVEVKDNIVNISIDPITITSEEILAILQDKGKIDVEKLPPALERGVPGWTWRGGEVVPLGGLSSDTKLQYSAMWELHGLPSIQPLLYTIDLRYDNPPTSTAAIDLHQAYDGTLPCAPIIRASLEELPIVEELGSDGTISIPESTIPTALYLGVTSTFDMTIINTGTLPAEYQTAITFEGIDVENEEVFWSEWSNDVMPNESMTLPVLIELSEQAIPIGTETAEYSILTKLVAR